MTDLDFRKRILAKEIKQAKAFVGASLIEALDEKRESDYILLLNEVLEHLEEAISLLEVKNDESVK